MKRIVRKVPKFPFGMSRKNQDRSDDDVNRSTPKEKEKEKDLPGQPSDSNGSHAFSATPRRRRSNGSSFFFNVPLNTATSHADDASATLHPDDSPRRSHSLARSKDLPAIPQDFAAGGAGALQQHQQQGPPTTGEVDDREVFESVEQNPLSVRFEINIVKVLVVSFVLDQI